MTTFGFQLGIETEMLLILREHSSNDMPDIERFWKSLTKHYNEITAGTGFPKMHSDIDGTYEGPNVTSNGQ